jgi:hypothetical protein
MFSHKTYLKLGDFNGTDFMSLIKGGYEVSDCTYSFHQGYDDRGKASTRVTGGTISLKLPMLPPDEIINWGINSRQYKNGVIVILDEENVPQEKILFENAACIHFAMDYVLEGKSYLTTDISLRAERIIFGSGLDFDNFWTK